MITISEPIFDGEVIRVAGFDVEGDAVGVFDAEEVIGAPIDREGDLLDDGDAVGLCEGDAPTDKDGGVEGETPADLTIMMAYCTVF